jgi:hypothetical protein
MDPATRAYDRHMVRRLSTTAVVACYLAASLAFMSAAVTGYWLVGGTALLDTVGGSLERLASSRSASAYVLAVVVLVAKVAAGAFAVVLARRPSRRLATLAALGGTLLALYGAVLTGAGALVLSDVLSVSPTDERALRWHTLFWDPWFLIWGLTLATAGIIIRRSTSSSSTRPASGGGRQRS